MSSSPHEGKQWVGCTRPGLSLPIGTQCSAVHKADPSPPTLLLATLMCTTYRGVQAVRKAAEARNQTGGNAAEESPEEDRPRPQEARRPLIKVKRGAVVTKRKNEPIRAGDPIKRTREVEPPDSGNANVLAGLLDGYESGSDCNESESKS